MTPYTLAALHAVCFRHPRPWRADEFAALLQTRGALLLTAPGGFLLGRAIGAEAELLTLAVDPAHRRHGIGGALADRFLAAARDAGAEAAFLEVASDNAAAQALYAGRGWQAAGRRKSYYAPGIDALVMRHDLNRPDSGG